MKRLLEEPFAGFSAVELHRRDRVFFIGGNLPVYETLETMYESYCLESTDLFYVTFAGPDDLERNLEMVRQIKKNFPVRLMGRIDFELSGSMLELTYLAGLDLLDVPLASTNGMPGSLECVQPYLKSAAEIYPRWSVVSSFDLHTTLANEMQCVIDQMLAIGIVPLPAVVNSSKLEMLEAATVFEYVVSAWHHHHVSLRQFLPFIRLVTPLDPSESPGFIRTVVGRIQDRHQLVTSDMRRHLRTSGAEASFESAGL